MSARRPRVSAPRTCTATPLVARPSPSDCVESGMRETSRKRVRSVSSATADSWALPCGVGCRTSGAAGVPGCRSCPCLVSAGSRRAELSPSPLDQAPRQPREVDASASASAGLISRVLSSSDRRRCVLAAPVVGRGFPGPEQPPSGACSSHGANQCSALAPHRRDRHVTV